MRTFRIYSRDPNMYKLLVLICSFSTIIIYTIYYLTTLIPPPTTITTTTTTTTSMGMKISNKNPYNHKRIDGDVYNENAYHILSKPLEKPRVFIKKNLDNNGKNQLSFTLVESTSSSSSALVSMNSLTLPASSYNHNSQQVAAAAAAEQNTHQIIIPEKYNEFNVKSRLIRERIEQLTSSSKKVLQNNQNRNVNVNDDDADWKKEPDLQLINMKLKLNNNYHNHNHNNLTKNVHIFYHMYIKWYFETDTDDDDNDDVIKDSKKSNKKNLTFSRKQNNSSNNTKMDKPLNIVFYPLFGLYNYDKHINNYLFVLEHHFRNIKDIGISVLIVPWQSSDKHFRLTQMKILLDMAERFELQIAIELASFTKRSSNTILHDIKLFFNNFWLHPGYYKVFVQSKQRYCPVFYVNAFYEIPLIDWNKILSIHSKISIRNTIYDAVLIGQINTKEHVSMIRTASFDGFYTRLPSNGATYASTWKNWIRLKKMADKYKLLFVPTVGPGYDERPHHLHQHQQQNQHRSNLQQSHHHRSRRRRRRRRRREIVINPNNDMVQQKPLTTSLQRNRLDGQYFGVGWRTAVSCNAQFISIASYNDWPLGTQIEEARSGITGFKEYQPIGPLKYLQLLEELTQDLIKNRLNAIDTVKNCYEFFNNTIC